MMGSKGDDTLIWIILAAAVGIIIIYVLWTKGLFPLIGGSSKTICESKLLGACTEGNRDSFTNIWIDQGCKNQYADDPQLKDAAGYSDVCPIILSRSTS